MNKGTRIMGLAGTNGSGKDTVGLLLAQHYKYHFISVTELLREECRRRNIPITRENTRLVSTQWRREFGYAVLIDHAMQAYEQAGGDAAYAGVVMSSLRNPHEADRIHELGGYVLWIDADPRIRYNRIQANAALRGRTGEDDVSFEHFLEEEAAEMHPPVGADEATLYTAAVKQKADVTLLNNTTPDHLHSQLDKLIKKLGY